MYGYVSSLGENEATSVLMDTVTMKSITGAEYKAIDDVNIKFEGWLAYCNEYGNDLQVAWTRTGLQASSLLYRIQ